jgi:hypothetical protein
LRLMEPNLDHCTRTRVAGVNQFSKNRFFGRGKPRCSRRVVPS